MPKPLSLPHPQTNQYYLTPINALVNVRQIRSGTACTRQKKQQQQPLEPLARSVYSPPHWERGDSLYLPSSHNRGSNVGTPTVLSVSGSNPAASSPSSMLPRSSGLTDNGSYAVNPFGDDGEREQNNRGDAPRDIAAMVGDEEEGVGRGEINANLRGKPDPTRGGVTKEVIESGRCTAS